MVLQSTVIIFFVTQIKSGYTGFPIVRSATHQPPAPTGAYDSARGALNTISIKYYFNTFDTIAIYRYYGTVLSINSINTPGLRKYCNTLK